MHHLKCLNLSEPEQLHSVNSSAADCKTPIKQDRGWEHSEIPWYGSCPPHSCTSTIMSESWNPFPQVSLGWSSIIIRTQRIQFPGTASRSDHCRDNRKAVVWRRISSYQNPTRSLLSASRLTGARAAEQSALIRTMKAFIGVRLSSDWLTGTTDSGQRLLIELEEGEALQRRFSLLSVCLSAGLHKNTISTKLSERLRHGSRREDIFKVSDICDCVQLAADPNRILTLNVVSVGCFYFCLTVTEQEICNLHQRVPEAMWIQSFM